VNKGRISYSVVNRLINSQRYLHQAHITMRLIPLVYLALSAAATPLQADKSLNSRNAKVNYDGYHVYSLAPSSALEGRELERRFERYHTHPVRDTLEVAIPPQDLEDFHALDLKARLVHSDLGSYIRSSEGKAPSYNSALHKRGELPDLSWYDSYHKYSDHLTYWDDLVAAFPDNSEKFEIGKSYENRSIYAFHLFGDEEKKGYGKSGKGESKVEKPIILWHATVHAREVRELFILNFVEHGLTPL
jgi:hypothetical protein